MIPLATPDLSGNEAAYLQECIATTLVSSVGPFVARFEEMVAAASNAEAAVATSSGTAGLHVALVAAGVRHGDLVILPTYTFIAGANAIAHAGATPWLVDIGTETWAIDVVRLADILERETTRRSDGLVHTATGRRVVAIMPVHTLGLPADMDEVVRVAREFGLAVVADAAAALGLTYKGRKVGALGADLSVFSFNGNKTITTGGGGAVVGRKGLVDRVRHLASTARNGPGYDHTDVGFNYRMTNIEAAVGCAQMERFEAMVAAKRRIDTVYRQSLAGLPGVGFFPQMSSSQSSCWLSGIVTQSMCQAEKLRLGLNEADIDVRPFWKPVHLQTPFLHAPATSMPVAESLWRRVLPLPCSSSLSLLDQERVCDVVRRLWG